MTELVWDEVGERRYETGIDRGVLYIPDAIPWNGLVSVNEHPGQDSKPYYLDGIKYMERQVLGSFSATLQAFTYPDELEDLIGSPEFISGMRLHDQPGKLFDMVYRTRVGNDVGGEDHGYKIHILYNVLAIPADYTYSTISKAPAITPFQWELKGTPSQGYAGIRPTGHLSLDSRRMAPTVLADLEVILYGDGETVPSLPSLPDLLAMVGSVG